MGILANISFGKGIGINWLSRERQVESVEKS